ncbi:hypothetical protein SAMN03159444_01276 [Pseudomonas sp. NFACC02]|uniref:hypothetical protein n=1 Tax=Pseudomonas sp. NFACC02 TaxID=1566250 RepID=UPI0008BFC6C1|nr:hypothetical protein [Pseudomonas sp. NFACC02]SEQ23212.1 hypothetical protein SAMN03159444_01276 [Pseudomonas sp. NFACC02]
MESTFDCWKVLDLPGRSDERSVKRQYAKLLKVSRPDEDPVGFQHLREAYEQALQILREHDEPDALACTHPANLPPIGQNRPGSISKITPSMYERAVELLSGLDDSAIDRCWTEALATGCAAELERLLFKRCVNEPNANAALLEWGLEQRQWLTPWQQIAFPESEQQRLVFKITTALYRELDKRMAGGEEDEFFSCLQHSVRQAWLADLARRQALQVHVLSLFLETEDWSPLLFQQVCQLFGWDIDGGVVPIADQQWHALRSRSEHRAWFNELHALAEQHQQSPSPRANAAALFLLTSRPDLQRELAEGFTEPDWQACEQLSETFASRFPDLLGLFPNHNPWFWQTLIVPKASPYGVKRAACALTIGLALHNLADYDLLFVLFMLPLYALGGLLGAQFGKWLSTHWVSLAATMYDLDLTISKWCARHRLTSDRRYLVIRSSGPLLMLGCVFWKWLGALGLATYVIVGVIGALQSASARPADRDYRWRKPLQAIYRIAGLSRLQWLFCVSMIFFIGYIQLHMPGTLLTQPWLSQ